MSNRVTPRQLIATYLQRRPNTRRCYAADLAAFAKWARVVGLDGAARALIGRGRSQCKRMLIGWLNEMRMKNLAANTIRRRIAALTSLVNLASDLDIMSWQIGRLPGLPPSARVRDCRGPALDVVERMFIACRHRGDAKGARDEAIMALLYWQALRASEVLSIRFCDIDLAGRAVRIIGKQSDGRIALGLAGKTVEALDRWIERRGDTPGPLFLTCPRSKNATPRPLTYWGLLDVVRTLGRTAGGKCWPHALRHAALSQLAALTDDSPPWGCALSRHRDIRAWAQYQDRRISHASAAEVLSRGQIVRRNPPTADN
jgi:integrase